MRKVIEDFEDSLYGSSGLMSPLDFVREVLQEQNQRRFSLVLIMSKDEYDEWTCKATVSYEKE